MMTDLQKVSLIASYILCLGLMISSMIITSHLNEATQDTITVYTTEDILYLRGKTITSESGIYDIELSSRNVAVDLLDEITASHSRSALRRIEDLEGGYTKSFWYNRE